MGDKTSFDETFLTNRSVYRSEITTVDSFGPDDNRIDDIRLDVAADQMYQQPVFNKKRLPEGERILTCNTSGRAYNGHLELFVWFTPPVDADTPESCMLAGPALLDGVVATDDERCHATLRVWAWGGIEGVSPEVGTLPTGDDRDEETSSSSLSSNFGRWCLVHEQTVVTDTLIPLRNVPAGRYRVTVDAISDGAQVDIVEQHTE